MHDRVSRDADAAARIIVRPVRSEERARWRRLMNTHQNGRTD
jgi:hypothetical protein